MGRNATLEQEVKFGAPIALALPDLRPLVAGTVHLPQQQLVTRYFDTLDHRLWRQGMTLRHRQAADQDEGVWTLKVPHPPLGSALQRTEVTWPGPSEQIPDDATAVLRGVVRREGLRQLTVLETTRQRLLLRDAHERDLAELDDDVVHVVGGPRDGARFRQVELEFLDGDWDGDRVLRRLERAGARVEKDQKLGKALALPDPSPGSGTLHKRSTVADAVRASLLAGTDRLISHDWRLRLALPDPAVEDVHQARVATRRLRSDLKTLGAVLDPVWLRHVRSELKWLGGVLGEVRDLDVLSEGLSDAPVLMRQRLAVQRAASGKRLEEVLLSKRYVNLVDRLHASAEILPLARGIVRQTESPAAAVLPQLVASRWRAVRRQVRRAGRHPSGAQLHRIRIKSKQLRYAAELATPVIGKPARRTASAAERVQTVLGQHHDAIAAEAWLRNEWTDDSARPAPASSPALAFEAGRLVAEAQQRQRRAEGHWWHAWAKLHEPKRRKWLPRS
jgi:CHAD domain-containing protein